MRNSVYKTSFDEDVPSEKQRGCPECGGRVNTTAHETACEACGLVIESDPIDRGPEWRSFADAENRARTGAPLTPARHDSGLSTEIGRKTDGKGRSLDGATRRKFHRLRREHRRARCESSADRNQIDGLTDIRRMASALGFGEGLRNQACTLFTTAQTEGLLIGRSVEAVAAASIYAACRCTGLPRPIGEVAAVARVDEPTLQYTYGVLNRYLELPAAPVQPPAYIENIASDVDLSPDVRQQARRLAADAVEQGVTIGCNPAGVAAACLYITARDQCRPVTQQALAAAANVSAGTIQAQRDELRRALPER